jgi:hypothetical protein
MAAILFVKTGEKEADDEMEAISKVAKKESCKESLGEKKEYIIKAARKDFTELVEREEKRKELRNIIEQIR